MGDLTATKKAWIFREYYGLPQAPEAADCIQYGKSLLCCANGDGDLADSERAWVMGFSYTNGVPWEEVSKWSTYEATDSIASLMANRPLLNFAARSVIYDAIRACAADNDYSAEEQQTIRRIASSIGLTGDDVAAIEKVWAAERDAKAKRIATIFPGRAISAAVPAANPATLREAWILSEYYGIDTPPSAEDFEVYAQLLLTLANSDGDLADSERNWVLGFAACSGVSEEGIERLRTYAGTDDPASLIQKSHVVADAKRAVVYDAIRACDADSEFSDAEKAAVYKAAERLGVDAEAMAAIESAWAAEKAAKLARQAVVFPQLAEIAMAMGA